MQTDEPVFSHRSVLLEETLRIIDVQSRSRVIDATLGLGGHSEAMLEASQTIEVIGFDQDEAAIEMATTRLERFGPRFRAVHGNFSAIREVVETEKLGLVDAVIADLGVSSLQLDDAGRGFSFRYESPLDMRMDATSGGPTAADLLRTTKEEDLANIIYRYGEERFSRRIARRIIERNKSGAPVTTTRELAEICERSVRRNPKDKIHPATRTFQALRIAVNRELVMLEDFLTGAIECLSDQGVLAVITFHSLEDRIVKHAFQRLSGKCTCPPRIPQCVCGATKKVDILTKKPILPGDDEIRENPRSRSAKLRACKRLGTV